MEYLRASREVRHALIINDPQPVDSVEKMWLSAGSAATVGIFILLFGGFLYVGKEILLPVVAAAVISLTLAPFIKAAQKQGISPWITAIILVAMSVSRWSLSLRPPRAKLSCSSLR